MNLHALPSGPIQTNGYLLTDPRRGEAVLIDAPGDIWTKVEPLLASEQCRLTELWLTHGHWDHIQDVAKVLRASKATVVRGHAADKHFFETPQIMSAFLSGRIQLEPVAITDWVTAGQRFTTLGIEVEVRHVPGHCPGNVLFFIEAAAAAFVGDAIFSGSVGRTDLPGGSAEVLAKSIREQIYTLPEATTLHPGHGPATTVGEEKWSNPFVKG